MNSIEIKKIRKSENWRELEWFIDGVRLSDYLVMKKSIELPQNIENFDDLCPAWIQDLDHKGDVKFVWHLIQSDDAIVPIYMCPDDLDFSCIVIVVEVRKTDEFVYWGRAGYVNEKNYDYNEEKRHGILFKEAYTDEDWKKYGDNIALAELDSDEWKQWIEEHWDEELFRRRMNYTYVNYHKDGNILWFADLNFIFRRVHYDVMVSQFFQHEKGKE